MKKLLLLLPLLCGFVNNVKPEDEARAYGKGLGLDVKGAACTELDSDVDNYVTCQLMVQNGDKLQQQQLLCVKRSSGTGCDDHESISGCKPR